VLSYDNTPSEQRSVLRGELACGAFVLLRRVRKPGLRRKIATNDDSEHAKAPQWDPSDLVTVIAERSAFITDTAALSYLRSERNERAHGTMPSAEERRALMRAAPTLAGLYVDYVSFFANQGAA